MGIKRRDGIELGRFRGLMAVVCEGLHVALAVKSFIGFLAKLAGFLFTERAEDTVIAELEG